MLEKLLQMADGPLREALAKSGTDTSPGAASAIEDVLGSLLQSKQNQETPKQ